LEYLSHIFKIILLFIYSLFPSTAEINEITVPNGFHISIFARELGQPRFMALSNDDVVFTTLINSGKIVALPDINKDGIADKIIVKASGLKAPNGIAFYKDWLYIGESHQVVRYKYSGYDQQLGEKEVVISKLPKGGHSTKSILFGKDNKLYLSIGSSCNVCIEKDERRAVIMQFNPDGTNGKIYARGLKNSVGLTLHPGTGEIWASDNGRDWLGDDLPPDEINKINEDKHYGWPYCYGDRVADPEKGGDRKFCINTEIPAFNMQAHSAPLGLTFYTAIVFPKEYRDDLFVAFHGSWNRSIPTGYKVVRINMRDNQPVSIQDFAYGWLKGKKRTGRPVDVLVNTDGSLLVSDDDSGYIYRIHYEK